MSEQSIKPAQQCQEPAGLPVVDSLMDLHGNAGAALEFGPYVPPGIVRDPVRASEKLSSATLRMMRFNPQFIAQSGPGRALVRRATAAHE